MTIGFGALAPNLIHPFSALPGVPVTPFMVLAPKVTNGGELVESPLYPGLWS